jgi:curved DNA-binding protein CbpA
MSHYSVLNVGVDANSTQIRDTYRTLALALHPDKQATDDLRREAREQFQLVNKAYMVLSDPNRRQVYDEFGEEGVGILEDEDNSQLRVASSGTEQVKQRVRDYLKQQNQAKLEAELNLQSVMMMELNAVDLFDGSYDVTRCFPEITQLVIQQMLTAPLSKCDRATLSGYVLSKHGMGAGNMRLAVRRQFSSVSMGEVGVDFATSPKLACMISRKLSKHSTGKISSHLEDGIVGLKVHASRQLSLFNRPVTGEVGWDLTPNEEGVSVGVSHEDNESRSDCTLKVGPGHAECQGSYVQYLTESSRLKVAAKAGLRAAEIEIGCGRSLSDRSRVHLGVALGLQGVMARLRFKRGTMRFNVPVILSPQPSLVVALLAALVPTLAAVALKQAIKPSQKVREYYALQRRRPYKSHRRYTRECCGDCDELWLFTAAMYCSREPTHSHSGLPAHSLTSELTYPHSYLHSLPPPCSVQRIGDRR